MEALLGAWFASQNRSLFAAKCFIETVLELHRGAISLASVQLGVSTACLESRQTLLTPLEQDILLLWVAIVMLTLEEVGVPRRGQVRRAAMRRSSTGALVCVGFLTAAQEPRQPQLTPLGHSVLHHCSADEEDVGVARLTGLGARRTHPNMSVVWCVRS